MSNQAPSFVKLGLSGLACVVLTFILAACAPTPQGNVLGYLIAKQLGALPPSSQTAQPGTLTGTILANGKPLMDATVVVAERWGTPHVGHTDAAGRYRIDGVPPGQYVPAAVAPGYDEAIPKDALGISILATIRSGETAQISPFALTPHVPAALPIPLLPSVQLSVTASYSATAEYPPGSVAEVQAFRFVHAGAVVDTLRLYLPRNLPSDRQLPMLFMIYPTQTDTWQPVSVAFAAQGYAMVAISPITQRGIDIEAHAQDARIAFALARAGALSSHIASGPVVALGGSFSSAILNRFLRDEGDHVAAWVTVGGISNAFTGATDFYRGRLQLPPEYAYAIPALGPANVYPLTFLQYSPVYSATQLPPTLIIHTAADHVTPIDQAYQLDKALRGAGVPDSVFYYQDVSHYLQIGKDMNASGMEMFQRVIEFVRQYQ